MRERSKYYVFKDFLNQLPDDCITITFSEIEQILGFKLPPSCYKYPSAWTNSNSHLLPQAWLSAGFRSEKINLAEQTITLRRIPSFNTAEPLLQRPRTRTMVPKLSLEDACSYIQSYYEESKKDGPNRYLAWDYCFLAFSNNRFKTDAPTVDYLALNLGMYLANFGMYRRSTFLLYCNYKVHIPAVLILQEKKYAPLHGITAENLCKEENLILLEELGNRIRKTYEDQPIEKNKQDITVTDTLVTKILLGSLACVPAYDQFFNKTLKKYHIANAVFTRKSVYSIASYYCDHKNIFDSLRPTDTPAGLIYPDMKLIDMCFWAAGIQS